MTWKALLIAMTMAAPAPMALACTEPANATALENEMIGWINAQRKAKGLNTLSKSAALAKAAQGHACDMADRGYFSHQRAGGPDLGQRLKSNGYRFRAAAENIAKMGSADVGRAAGVWRKSSGHWANILKPGVSEIGMGLATAGGQYYWVMNVGKSR